MTIEELILAAEALLPAILKAIDPNMGDVAQSASDTLMRLLQQRALSVGLQKEIIDETTEAALRTKFPK